MSEKQGIIVRYGGFSESNRQDNYLIVFRDEYSESQRSSRTHGPSSFAEVTNDMIHDITKVYKGRIYTLIFEEDAKEKLSKSQISVLEGIIEFNNKITSARDILSF